MSKHFEMRYKLSLPRKCISATGLAGKADVMYFNSFDFFKHDYLIALGS